LRIVSGIIILLPARRYDSAGNSDRKVSVRLSVCHAPVLCENEESYSVMISSPSGSPVILVFWCQISSRHFKRFPEREPQTRSGG